MVFSINPTKEKTQAAFKEKAIAQNGEGGGTPITGGEPPADGTEQGGEQPEQGQETGGEGATPGQGVVGQDGSCLCVVSCSAGGFPAADAQGLGSWGGQAGSLPVRMAGVTS